MRYLLLFFTLLPVMGSAQLNLVKEIQYYNQLIDTGLRLKKGYKAIKEAHDKSQLMREILYSARRKKAVDLDAGSIVTKQMEVIYDSLEETVANYELPEIEEIPETIPPLNGSREATSNFLTQYTNNTIYYYSKLKSYLQKQKEINILETLIHEVKIENRRIAVLYQDLIKSGVLSVIHQAAVNDWYTIEVNFSKQLGNTLSSISTKKKKWEKDLKARAAQYRNYKANLQLVLESESESLQEELDKAEQRIKNYTFQVTTLNKEIEKISSYIDEIPKSEADISHYSDQIRVLQNNIVSYEKSIQRKSATLKYVSSNEYYKTYSKCPNKLSFKKCKHTEEKDTFRIQRRERKKRLNESIYRNKDNIKTSKEKISNYSKNISALRRKIKEMYQELQKLPGLKDQLQKVTKERDEYLEQLEVYYIFFLKRTNTLNQEKIQNLANQP